MRHPQALLLFLSLASSLEAQSTTRVSVDASGAQANAGSSSPSISADGHFATFSSSASNLVPGDTNGKDDVFVRDLASGTLLRVSISSSGAQGNGNAGGSVLSADGTKVAFLSDSTNLVSGDVNGQWDVFVHDLVTGQTLLASVSSSGVQADSYSNAPAISSDGRFVAFENAATNLVAGDTNGMIDIFVHDVLTGQTVRASSGSTGAEPNENCMLASISGDGHFVAFQSMANNLVPGDTNATRDIFLRDLWSGSTTRVNLNSAGAQSSGNAALPRLTPDGRYLLFTSDGGDLVSGDTNGSNDAFVRDLVTGVTTRASVSSTGAGGTGLSASRDISADGRYVLFVSDAANLSPGDTNLAWDDLIHDRATGQTLRVSVATSGTQGNSMSNFAAISADGRWILFQSSASNLVAGDTNGADDIFLRDRGTLAATAFCFGDGTQATACPCGNSGASGRGCENSAATGGALLELSGFADPDSATLSASGLLPNALSIFLQGNAQFGTPALFGDGLRCAGGTLKRLYLATASGGAALAPAPGQLALGLQSASLGDPIAPGSTRFYQVWYRDPDTGFCPAPTGNLWNVTNGVRVDW